MLKHVHFCNYKTLKDFWTMLVKKMYGNLMETYFENIYNLQISKKYNFWSFHNMFLYLYHGLVKKLSVVLCSYT